eukprot:1143868-Pelagomonas_calceolata.AAC.1
MGLQKSCPTMAPARMSYTCAYQPAAPGAGMPRASQVLRVAVQNRNHWMLIQVTHTPLDGSVVGEPFHPAACELQTTKTEKAPRNCIPPLLRAHTYGRDVPLLSSMCVDGTPPGRPDGAGLTSLTPSTIQAVLACAQLRALNKFVQRHVTAILQAEFFLQERTPKQPTSAPKQPEGASTPEPGPKIANTPQQKPKTTSIPKQEPASTGSNSLKDKVLSVHNNLRARHQASPLSWSSSLAAGAQSWASGCEWGHAGVEEGESCVQARVFACEPFYLQIWPSVTPV